MSSKAQPKEDESDYGSHVIQLLSASGQNERKLSTTVKKNLSRIKFDENAQELLTVHKSLRPNQCESLNSQPLWPGINNLLILQKKSIVIVFRKEYIQKEKKEKQKKGNSSWKQ